MTACMDFTVRPPSVECDLLATQLKYVSDVQSSCGMSIHGWRCTAQTRLLSATAVTHMQAKGGCDARAPGVAYDST